MENQPGPVSKRSAGFTMPPTPQLIHMVVNLVALGALFTYFKGKTSRLESSVEELSTLVKTVSQVQRPNTANLEARLAQAEKTISNLTTENRMMGEALDNIMRHLAQQQPADSPVEPPNTASQAAQQKAAQVAAQQQAAAAQVAAQQQAAAAHVAAQQQAAARHQAHHHKAAPPKSQNQPFNPMNLMSVALPILMGGGGGPTISEMIEVEAEHERKAQMLDRILEDEYKQLPSHQSS